MHFISHTPESLLPRSDSKNPATTCKGITTSGRPCRRALGSSPRSSPGPSPLQDRGVLAVLRDGQDGNDAAAAAAFYCWQHKEQAERVAQTEQNHTELFPLPERTSIDTLVDRVGVMNLNEQSGRKEGRHRRGKLRDGQSPTSRILPADWQRMDGPLMSVPHDIIGTPAPEQPPRPTRQRPKSNVKASLFCCIRDAGDDDLPPLPHGVRQLAAKPRPTATFAARQDSAGPMRHHRAPSPSMPSPIPRKPAPSTPNRTAPTPNSLQTPHTPTRPILATTPKSSSSQTQELLSLIPPQLSPQTTSTLLSELSKPISPADAAGYIYMFWLTPESDPTKPDDDAASDLLLEPPKSRPAHQHRHSDVLQRYASTRQGASQPRTVLLKIGRAENVHRRLSQWAKQCAYNITLIRYYPYTPSSRTPLPQPDRNDSDRERGGQAAAVARKVRHVHRVERLIHVELAESRVREQGVCEKCGREHREWFEVEASREGLRSVDEVIRKWVGWAERQG